MADAKHCLLPTRRSQPLNTKPRLLIFIVAYFAEHTIEKVVRRIPVSLLDTYDKNSDKKFFPPAVLEKLSSATTSLS
jgi:hypothetical protein